MSGRDGIALQQALAERRSHIEAAMEVKRLAALRIKRANPEFTNAAIGERLGLSGKTISRWLEKEGET